MFNDVSDVSGKRKDRNKVDGDGDRLQNNVCRARSRVRELALCNEWDYFVTLTFDKDKVQRNDLSGLVRRLGNWFGNIGKRYRTKVRYVIIPEQHKSGDWHFHGLLRGLPCEAYTVNEYGYLTIPSYNKNFGFISLSPVKSHRRIASYITKYITKDFGSEAREKGEHLFYSSQGLRGKEDLFAFPVPDSVKGDFENDYCGLTWVDSKSKLSEILDSISEMYFEGENLEARELCLVVQNLISYPEIFSLQNVHESAPPNGL